MPDKTPLLFPVETINRELDFRLMMAGMLARRDRMILVGQHDVLAGLLPELRGGVYLGKNLFRHTWPNEDLKRYQRAKARDVVLIHLDEEGGFYRGDQEDWASVLESRIDARCLGSDDWMCTWGGFQADHYRKRAPSLAEHIRTTGHPRFDLLKEHLRSYYDADVARLKRRFGRFILINTNLSWANNARGLADTFSGRFGGNLEDPDTYFDHVRGWAHQASLLPGFVELAHRLAREFPEYNVIVRPHPAEDFEFYRATLSRTPRVHVVHEGPVVPWLLAAEAVILDGCTTAFEGYLAARPVISFKSVEAVKFDVHVANEFGFRCTSQEEVVAAMRGVVAGTPPEHPEASQRARAVLANLDMDSVTAVVDVIEAAETSLTSKCRPPSEASMRRAELQRRAVHSVKAVARTFSPTRQRYARAARNAFYGLDRSVIADKVRRVERLLGRSVPYVQISDSLLVFPGER